MIRIQKEYGGKLYVVVNDRIVNPNFNISHTGGLAF
jgi:phosphopantetheinyl transferase